MSTITIRLPEELKVRVALVAKRLGKTADGFVLEAIVQKAEEDERREDLHAVAEQRSANIVASGKTIPWAEMRGYLEARQAGKTVKHPVARKLAPKWRASE